MIKRIQSKAEVADDIFKLDSRDILIIGHLSYLEIYSSRSKPRTFNKHISHHPIILSSNQKEESQGQTTFNLPSPQKQKPTPSHSLIL